MKYELDNDELNTILAALRAYQQRGYGDPFSRPDWLQSIACPDGDSTSLDDGAIDKLCERLNCDVVSLVSVGKHTPGPWEVAARQLLRQFLQCTSGWDGGVPLGQVRKAAAALLDEEGDG